MNSVCYRKWVVWHMNSFSYTYVLKFYVYIALDSWKTCEVSLSFPCAVTCTLWHNDSIYCPFRTANNAILYTYMQ